MYLSISLCQTSNQTYNLTLSLSPFSHTLCHVLSLCLSLSVSLSVSLSLSLSLCLSLSVSLSVSLSLSLSLSLSVSVSLSLSLSLSLSMSLSLYVSLCLSMSLFPLSLSYPLLPCSTYLALFSNPHPLLFLLLLQRHWLASSSYPLSLFYWKQFESEGTNGRRNILEKVSKTMKEFKILKLKRFASK